MKRDASPAGYEWLIGHFNLEVMPHWHRSFINRKNAHKEEITKTGAVKEFFPLHLKPKDDVGSQLEFALKYDGINLAILEQLFQYISKNELTDYIKQKPTGQNTRRLWFLFEFITGSQLEIADLKQGTMVELLDPKRYIVSAKPLKSSRHRIKNNLLGNHQFCPMVRKTNTLDTYIRENLSEKISNIIADGSPELIKRAMSYLYTKETKSSFEIESEKPSAKRSERFINLLRNAELKDYVDEDELIRLQNKIVDERFKDPHYRTSQNYVSSEININHQLIHYITPKPDDICELMQGLIAANQSLYDSAIHPIIHAAIISYGFVFLHPFEDGNGRIHRFIIHNILALREFVQEGIMLPVSASMLEEKLKYDESLECFSKPLMTLIDYEEYNDGIIKVLNETLSFYRFMDMTSQAEHLFYFIKKTIDELLPREILFLKNYEKAKEEIQDIVDMPDKKINLLIQVVIANKGSLSKGKRENYFEFLSNEECSLLEQIIRKNFT